MTFENRTGRQQMSENRFYTYLQRFLTMFKECVRLKSRNCLNSTGFGILFIPKKGAGSGEANRAGGMSRGGGGLSLAASALLQSHLNTAPEGWPD